MDVLCFYKDRVLDTGFLIASLEQEMLIGHTVQGIPHVHMHSSRRLYPFARVLLPLFTF